MAKLGSDILVSPQDLYSVLPTPQTNLGSRASNGDGRVYRYVQFDPVTGPTGGNLLQSPASVANHQHISVAAAAATGAYVVTATLGASSATQSWYSNGYASVDSGSGLLGYTYSILGNNQTLSSGVITLQLGEPLQQALPTSATLCLTPNSYQGVIQMPTTITGIPVGVAVSTASAGYYGWIQTRGVASVLSDSLVALKGAPVQPSSTTAGCITCLTTSTATAYVVGNAVVAPVSATTKPVFLTLE